LILNILIVHGDLFKQGLAGLVLTSDLNNAQQQFLGETVYPKFRKLSGLYVPGMALPQAETIEIGSSQ